MDKKILAVLSFDRFGKSEPRCRDGQRQPGSSQYPKTDPDNSNHYVTVVLHEGKYSSFVARILTTIVHDDE